MTQNQIAYWTLGEGRRHNVISEKETIRHNKAQEAIQRSQIELGYAQLSEQKRNNDLNFVLNKARQLTDEFKAQTSERARQDNARYQTLVVEESTRHNVATEQEMQRHNEATELISSNTNFLRGQELELNKLKFGFESTMNVINAAKEAILGKKGLIEYLMKFIS